MYKFIVKMSNGNGLLKDSLVELPLFGTYWVYEHGYNFGNHLVIQSRMSRTSTFLLACTEHRLVPCSPACDLRTLGLTLHNAAKFTTHSTFHGQFSFL